MFGRSTQQAAKQSPEKKFANVESSSKVPFELSTLENDAVITLPTLPTSPPQLVQPVQLANATQPTRPTQPIQPKPIALSVPQTMPSKVEPPIAKTGQPTAKAELPAVKTELVTPTSNNVEEEEALYEEDREMGSKPTVRLPDRALNGGWNVAKPKTYRPRVQKLPTEVESQSAMDYVDTDSNRLIVSTITVHIKGIPIKHIQRRGQHSTNQRYANQQHGMRSQQGPNSPNFRGGKSGYRGRSSRESSGSIQSPNTPTAQKPVAPRVPIQTGYPQAPISRPNPGMTWSRVANIAAVGRG